MWSWRIFCQFLFLIIKPLYSKLNNKNICLFQFQKKLMLVQVYVYALSITCLYFIILTLITVFYDYGYGLIYLLEACKSIKCVSVVSSQKWKYFFLLSCLYILILNIITFCLSTFKNFFFFCFWMSILTVFTTYSFITAHSLAQLWSEKWLFWLRSNEKFSAIKIISYYGIFK